MKAVFLLLAVTLAFPGIAEEQIDWKNLSEADLIARLRDPKHWNRAIADASITEPRSRLCSWFERTRPPLPDVAFDAMDRIGDVSCCRLTRWTRTAGVLRGDWRWGFRCASGVWAVAATPNTRRLPDLDAPSQHGRRTESGKWRRHQSTADGPQPPGGRAAYYPPALDAHDSVPSVIPPDQEV